MNHESRRDLALEKEQAGHDEYLSASEKHRLRKGIFDEHIADLKQHRALRHYAFFGVVGSTAVFAALLMLWTGLFGYRLFFSDHIADLSNTRLILIPIVLLAAYSIVLMLAMIRFVFRLPA